MARPVWTLKEPNPGGLHHSPYDAIRLREIVLRFPTDVPAGGYVRFQPTFGGRDVDEAIDRALGPEDTAALQTSAVALLEVLAARFGLVGCTLTFLPDPPPPAPTAKREAS